MIRFLTFCVFLLSFFQTNAQCLSGTYTIGGFAPDYNNILNAVNALNSNGVCGPVVFNIRNGHYDERLLISNIQGISSTNTIIFQSEQQDSNLVIISSSSFSVTNPYVLKLDEVSHITFRKVTLQTNHPDLEQVVELAGNTTDVLFENNIIKGLVIPPFNYNYYKGIICWSDTGISNINIERNLILYGRFGVHCYGNDNGFLINDNEFQYQGNGAVYLAGAENSTVTNNRIK